MLSYFLSELRLRTPLGNILNIFQDLCRLPSPPNRNSWFDWLLVLWCGCTALIILMLYAVLTWMGPSWTSLASTVLTYGALWFALCCLIALAGLLLSVRRKVR